MRLLLRVDENYLKQKRATSVGQERDNMPLPQLQQLVSSVPDVYRCF